MKTSLFLATLAVCAIMTVPASLADPWMAYGEAEPNTVHDDTDFIWADAPGVIKDRIYFSGYSTSGTTTMNPNVGALGTKIESVAVEEQFALLGVWTDCNGDGYIGLAETAAREYRSELLTNTALCPPGGGNNLPTAGNNAWNGANNYAGWVTELIPIGSNATTQGDRRVIKDPKAAVWGDFGRPDDPATAAGATCAINPLPRGTTQSTGGALTHADCFTNILGRWNQVMDAAGDPAGLRFPDDNNGRSHALGQQTTLGDAHSDKTIVKAQDCGQPILVPTGNDEAGNAQGLRAPSTNVNADGTVAGTVNYTIESMPLPRRQVNAQNGPESTSNCNPNDDRGGEPYSFLESDFNGTSNTKKTSAQWNFGFDTMTRGGLPLGGLTGSGGAPSDAGIEAISGCTICQNSEWFGGSTQVSKLPRTVVTRGTVGEPDFVAEINSAYWLTYYAYVGEVSLAKYKLPGPAAGKAYGSFSTQCGSFTSGVRNGWDCDKANWNLNPDGSPQTDPNGVLAYPGKIYQLRDADCYDGEISGTGLGVLPAFFGPRPCRLG